MVIHWLDAASVDSWHDPGDKNTSQECFTVGILRHADENCISVTHTFGVTNGKDDSTCCSMAIPQGCIVDAYELNNPEERMKKVRGKKCKR